MKEMTDQEILEHIDMFRENLELCLDESGGETDIRINLFYHAMKELCEKMKLPCLKLDDYVQVAKART